MYGDNIALMSIMPELMANGVNPFFVLQREGDFSAFLLNAGYKYIVCKFTYNNIYNLSNPKISYLKRLVKGSIWNLKKCVYLKDALNLLKDFKPQLIHTNNSANSFGLELAEKFDIPHVWHIREYMDLDHNRGFFPSKKSFERLLDHPLNACVCITEDVSNHFNTISQKHVIYDGVIKDADNIFEIAKKENSIIYVGRLIETKGVYDIVNSFAKVIREFPNYTLKFIGDGDQIVKDRLQELVRVNKLSKNVEFLGYKTNVSEYMKRAKAIVVSSRFEAFGLITAEAMNNGCLVIGRNTAGTKVQFDNGVFYTGKEIALRYESNKGLEYALKQVMTMPADTYKEMVIRAHKTAVHFYNVKRSTSSIISFYSELLDR